MLNLIRMKKAIILFLALSSAIAYVTDMQAQTTERQDAVGKFRIDCSCSDAYL